MPRAAHGLQSGPSGFSVRRPFTERQHSTNYPLAAYVSAKIPSATKSAIAYTVSCGFTPAAVGKIEASAT